MSDDALFEAARLMYERSEREECQRLRDEFAMAALTAFLSRPDTRPEDKAAFPDMFNKLAELSYQQADAMLAQREKAL